MTASLVAREVFGFLDSIPAFLYRLSAGSVGCATKKNRCPGCYINKKQGTGNRDEGIDNKYCGSEHES